MSDDYDLTLADLEGELDHLYPLWDTVVSRTSGQAPKGLPFQALSYDRLARLKWLLKRRSHLTSTEDQSSFGVAVTQSKADPRKCFAVSTLPEPGVPRPLPPRRLP